jgi:hypothetical protein
MAGTAPAQTTPPAAAPAPVDRQSALYRQPTSAEAAKLAPVNGPIFPTQAARLPVAKLHVPDGFKAEVFASGVGNTRSMRVGGNGPVFVGSRVLD